MKLIATPLSHFARKTRILLDLYSIPYEMQFLSTNVALTKSPLEVANNPLMKVPVLVDGGEWIIESDHIASYIVKKFDAKDKFKVNSGAVFDLNVKAVLNGVMNEEVKVIVAGRHQVPTENYSYFAKARSAVENGLDWMESHHHKLDGSAPSYKEFHLVCCWDHLEYYNFVPEMTVKYPRLRDIAARVSESPVIASTAPNTMVPK